jgi:hypothetical protein
MKDDTVRRFLMLIDGTRTVDMLVAEMNAADKSAGYGVGAHVTREEVQQNLGLLARLGLLTA